MNTSTEIAKGLLKALGVILGLALICYLLFEIQTVILYLFVSLILSLIGSRIISFLKNRLKFNNLWASTATMFFFVAIILCFISLFVPLITSQSENLSLLNIKEIETKVFSLLNQIDKMLSGYGINLKDILTHSDLYSNINLKIIPNFLNGIIETVSNFGIGLVSVLFITFFFLKDQKLIVENFKNLLPKNHEERILISLSKINKMLSRYFIGLMLQLLVVFILYFIVLVLFGINNALIIAFLCALLNIVPYVGPIIGTIFAAILTMLDYLGTDFETVNIPTTIYVVIGFCLVQAIDNNISQPIIFSNTTESHPLEIFLVILIAGFLFGIFGMIVAIPLFTILKVVAKEFFPEVKIVQLLTKNL